MDFEKAKGKKVDHSQKHIRRAGGKRKLNRLKQSIGTVQLERRGGGEYSPRKGRSKGTPNENSAWGTVFCEVRGRESCALSTTSRYRTKHPWSGGINMVKPKGLWNRTENKANIERVASNLEKAAHAPWTLSDVKKSDHIEFKNKTMKAEV